LHENHQVPTEAAAPAKDTGPNPNEARGVTISFSVSTGTGYPTGPNTFQFLVYAWRGSFNGCVRVPLSLVPSEILSMGFDEAMEHPWIVESVAEAKANLAERIRKALAEVA
jgi:hypothetical protein